jgi:hypothetical protein
MLSWRCATLHYSTQGEPLRGGYGGGPLYQSRLCFTIEAMLGEGDEVAIRTGAAGKTKCWILDKNWHYPHCGCIGSSGRRRSALTPFSLKVGWG